LDLNNKIDRVYNYGTFDFNTPNFYGKFAQGKLLYQLRAYNFGNFFENANELKNKDEIIVSENNLHETSKEYTYVKEPFMSSSADLASFKTRALVESLNNSSATKMFNKQ
jgi:hypothetical protein